jgi:class 3 adenylate cyclase
MVRRVTPSQYRNIVRQAQQKQKRAVDKYNREVRAHNQKVKKAVADYNRDVREHNRRAKQETDRANREIRAYNARVRADRQRLKNELSRLAQKKASSRYQEFRITVNSVQSAYERLDEAAEAGKFSDHYNSVLDLSEREAANNAGLMNALLGDAVAADEPLPDSPESHLTPILINLSNDLADRWQGAVYALNPRNPDAARHFCTSAREIIARILDEQAPDDAVVAVLPNCELTQNGSPTRRAKIRYFLQLKGMGQQDLEEFVENDIENVVQLFHIFNQGTHGSAGTFGLPQLQAIRKRVEDGITFLASLIS